MTKEEFPAVVEEMMVQAFKLGMLDQLARDGGMQAPDPIAALKSCARRVVEAHNQTMKVKMEKAK